MVRQTPLGGGIECILGDWAWLVVALIHRFTGNDFKMEPVLVVLTPNGIHNPQTSICIIDDTTYEPTEGFILLLELYDALEPSKVATSERGISLALILNNDSKWSVVIYRMFDSSC